MLGRLARFDGRRVILAAVLLAGCRRSPKVPEAHDAGPAAAAPRDAICWQQSDGCVWCVGREREQPILEAEQSRPTVCDPREPDNCVEFCTAVTPDCALSWHTEVPGCVYDSKATFYRARFNRDTADLPAVVLNGRVVDEAGRRVEGAQVRVWVSLRTRVTELLDPPVTSGKDGSFRLTFRLPPRGGSWTYVLRLSHPGLATEIVDRVAPERIDRTGQPRTFKLGPEHLVKGRVLDAESGSPIVGATVKALRTSEDSLESGEGRTGDDGSFTVGGLEARRYFLQVSKFGWRTLMVKNPVTAPAARVMAKLERNTVVTGLVRDAAGEPVHNAWMAAVLSGSPDGTIFTWTTDGGRFAEEMSPGTYYVWARRGDTFLYPPEKIELPRGHEVEVSLTLNHKGAHVSGRVLAAGNFQLGPDTGVILLPGSPLAFPRATAAEIGADHRFVFAGMLPGRYEISVRDGSGHVLEVVQGPRYVEVPIEPDSNVTLAEPVAVKPPASSE